MTTIRNETESDRQIVEQITRRAFYNLYMPGCIEHYLVHVMRSHEDFIPELDLVIELDDEIIGNIMYTKSWLENKYGERKEILTFGPVSIDPIHQRKGYGRMLMECSFKKAKAMGYGAIVIFGSPYNYVGLGFESCRKHGIGIEGGRFPSAMLVKELSKGAIGTGGWTYHDSPVMAVSLQEASRYDDTLPPMEKKHMPSQEEFYIMSHSFID